MAWNIKLYETATEFGQGCSSTSCISHPSGRSTEIIVSPIKGFLGRASSIKWLLPLQGDAVSHECTSLYCPRVLNQIRRCSNYKVAWGWSGASLAGFISRGKASIYWWVTVAWLFSGLECLFLRNWKRCLVQETWDFKHSWVNDKRGGWIKSYKSFFNGSDVILNQTKWCHTQVNVYTSLSQPHPAFSSLNK